MGTLTKNVFIEYCALVIGVCDATITFNEDAKGRLKLLRAMGIEPGHNTTSALCRIDQDRVKYAERAAEASSKEGRIEKRRRKADESAEADNDDYSSGMH